MIVVLIIGILLAMAVPNWLNTRENSRQKSCLSNLTQIDDAKEIWATENKASETSTPQSTDLVPTYMKDFPSCPASGVYSINQVGQDASCTYTTGNWPHVLPN
jgi:Tfp pilus assembly protein PilE